MCARRRSTRQVARAIRAHFTAFDLIEGEGEVALALRWQGAASYEAFSAFAEGIRHGLAPPSSARSRIYLMPMATSPRRLGDSARGTAGRERDPRDRRVVLRDFDYIDLRRIRMPSFTVPVTIKSLLSAKTRAAAARTSASIIMTRITGTGIKISSRSWSS